MPLKVDLIKVPKARLIDNHPQQLEEIVFKDESLEEIVFKDESITQPGKIYTPDYFPNPREYFIMIANSRSGHNFVKENIMSWRNEENFHPSNYINLENVHPKDFKERTKEYELEKYPPLIPILQTRDLLNWFASLIHFVSRERYWKSQPDIREKIKKHALAWIAINKEFYGETSYLSDKWIHVSYDDFFLSPEYRKNICQEISGAEYNENRLNVVTPNGGGSSFDSINYQGKASEMLVLERYKQVSEEHQHVWKVLKEYPEAIELYLKYFDVSDEKKLFIDNIK